MISSNSNAAKAQEMLQKDYDELNSLLKNITKSSMERLLRGASGLVIAEELLNSKSKTTLNDSELVIIQKLQRVQENILALTLDGYEGVSNE